MSHFDNILASQAKSIQASANQREKQRRHWRLVLSIALLLPALAALIGIVAWAISVEVASNGADVNHRKMLQHHNYNRQHQIAYQLLRQQERHSNGKPIAAAIVSSEGPKSKRTSSQNSLSDEREDSLTTQMDGRKLSSDMQHEQDKQVQHSKQETQQQISKQIVAENSNSNSNNNNRSPSQPQPDFKSSPKDEVEDKIDDGINNEKRTMSMKIRMRNHNKESNKMRSQEVGSSDLISKVAPIVSGSEDVKDGDKIDKSQGGEEGEEEEKRDRNRITEELRKRKRSNNNNNSNSNSNSNSNTDGHGSNKYAMTANIAGHFMESPVSSSSEQQDPSNSKVSSSNISSELLTIEDVKANENEEKGKKNNQKLSSNSNNNNNEDDVDDEDDDDDNNNQENHKLLFRNKNSQKQTKQVKSRMMMMKKNKNKDLDSEYVDVGQQQQQEARELHSFMTSNSNSNNNNNQDTSSSYGQTKDSKRNPSLNDEDSSGESEDIGALHLSPSDNLSLDKPEKAHKEEGSLSQAKSFSTSLLVKDSEEQQPKGSIVKPSMVAKRFPLSSLANVQQQQQQQQQQDSSYDNSNGNSNSNTKQFKISTPSSLSSKRFKIKEELGTTFQRSNFNNKVNLAKNDEDVSFEAIADAISSTLGEVATVNKQKRDRRVNASEGDTGDIPFTTVEKSTDEQADRNKVERKRKQSTGEHVAELIDQIVERHGQGSKFSDLSRAHSQSETGQSSNRGPQIVVVSPQRQFEDSSMKARSLVKEEPIKPSSTSTTTQTSVTEKRWSRPIGARLLGVEGEQSEGKYSERVQVIEDDDSSALLMPLATLESDNDSTSASIHVSSQPNKPKSRSQRHDLSPSVAFERYSSSSKDSIESKRTESNVDVGVGVGVERRSSPQEEQQAKEAQAPEIAKPELKSNQVRSEEKLYSAEQLIREHLMRSKAKAIKPAQLPKSSKSQVNRDTQPTEGSSSTQTSSESPDIAQKRPQSQQQVTSQQQQQQQNQPQMRQELQAIKVPILFEQSSMRHRPQEMRLAPERQLASEPYQASESQESSSGYLMSNQNPYIAQSSQIQQQQNQNKNQPSQQSQTNKYSPNQMMHQQTSNVQSQLPIIPDQEFNVPAHLADSVIQDIQRSPSTVGYVNGKLTLLPMPNMNQVPYNQQQQLQAASSFIQSQQVQPMTNQQYNNNQQQQKQEAVIIPLYAAPQAHQAHLQGTAQSMQPQQNNQESQSVGAQVSSSLRSAGNLFSRLLHGRDSSNSNNRYSLSSSNHNQYQPQPQQQQQSSSSSSSLFQQQHLVGSYQGPNKMLANRNSVDSASTSTLDANVSPKSSLTSKAFIHPVAKFAIKHLINSISQEAPTLPQSDVASRSADNEASKLHHHHHQQQQQQQVQAQASPQVDIKSSFSSHEQMITGGSSPRQMRQLMPTQQGSASSDSHLQQTQLHSQQQQQQQQIQLTDQDAQESYGQMPVYQMQEEQYPQAQAQHHYQAAPAEYPGVPAPPYGHQPDHDKRTKGMTFHFGGGPIGGGTQLITSPMGIFKHLMLPLLPNPRVNLNGKVVFGVVLEKSTAFGSQPYPKKRKFWG